jgi:hypothetical protein
MATKLAEAVNNKPTPQVLTRIEIVPAVIIAGQMKKIAGFAIVAALAAIFSGQARLPAPGPRMDCTGTNDSSAWLQNAINTTLDAGTITIPLACTLKIGTTINMVDRVGLQIISPVYQQNWGGGRSPRLLWTGNGGTMFSVRHSDHPVFMGLGFYVAQGASVDTFLSFDGAGGQQIGTAALIQRATTMAFSRYQGADEAQRLNRWHSC